MLAKKKEIIIVLPHESGFEEFYQVLKEVYQPHSLLLVVKESEIKDYEGPLKKLVDGKKALNQMPTAYVCENYTCKFPVTSIEKFKKLLSL